jgi:PTH2 family peptidyl-tRNA hydrolase
MVKQVIVMRKDLNMRKGKMVAQGCHAAIGSLKEASSKDIKMWEEDGCTKICVSVDSELALKSIYAHAVEAVLPCYLVLDAGRTEFKQPTYTCCSIGPASTELIDKITGTLTLL